MLQRQVMFKQLQELQRRQQLQEFSDARNQDYASQLSSLKQASGIQFAPTVNWASVHDSQMIQHGGSSIFQGFPNGLVLSQSNDSALGPVGLSLPQCDMSSYGTNVPHVPNTDKNLSLYSHLQGPSNHSANLLTMNTNSALGLSAMYPSAVASSFMSQQGNFSSEQISTPEGLLLPNQVFQEKNLFGQAPAHSLHRDLLLMNYSQQGISMQENTSVLGSDERCEDSGSHGTPPGAVSKISQPAGSLDPLEQKILYDTDDNSWELSFGSSRKVSTVGLESADKNPSYLDALPSIQSGSWSALMQSAVSETSGGDTAIQEEWSGLSFQNPEPSADSKPLNFINSENPQYNWVSRNMQNVSSPHSEPEPLFQKSSKNYSFPGFQHSVHQYHKQKDEFHSESSHGSGKHSSRNASQLAETSLPAQNNMPAQRPEMRGPLWLNASSSNSVTGGMQKSFDQVNQTNIHRYSVKTDMLTPGDNVKPMSALVGASSDLHGENFTAQSKRMLDVLNKDGMSNNHGPGIQLNSKAPSLSKSPLAEASAAYFSKPCNNSPVSQGFGFKLGPIDAGTSEAYSFSPSLPMGNSCATSLTCDYMNDYIKNQHQALPVSCQLTGKIPARSATSSQVNFQMERTNAGGPEFPLMEKVAVTQSSRASDLSQGVVFLTGSHTPIPDTIPHGDVFSPKPCNYSSNLFQSLDPASSNLENSSRDANEQPNQNCIKSEHNVQEFGTCSGKSGYCEQKLEKGISLHEGLPEIHIPTSMSSIHAVESSRKQYLEAHGAASGSFMTCTSWQPSNQAEQKDDKTPAVPSRSIRAFGHSLQQNYSLLHQLHSPRNAETDCGKSLPLKYDSINHQQSIANARELLLSGKKSLVKDQAKYDLEAVQLGASPGSNRRWNFSSEAPDNQSGKTLSTACLQDFQQMDKLGQNGSKDHSISSNEVSNVAYQSQIDLQMAPSWFKHYGSAENGLVLPTYNSKAASNAAQPFYGFNIGNVQGNNPIMLVNSSNANQASDSLPSSAATLIASKNLSPPSLLPPDDTCQNLAISKLKKRKIGALDMIPWHGEVNNKAPRFQSISMCDLEWARVLNQRQEEALCDAKIVEDLPPAIQAKRRLILTTQLMQQVFRPAPSVIFLADASSNYDDVAYSAARLALGDACNLNIKLPPSTNDMSLDKLKTSKGRSNCDFSEVVEGLINQVKKLEGDLSRLDRNLSMVDIKVESKDLEKFSTINRFAKFHIRAPSGTVDPTSSSGQSTMQRARPQRYVVALPMPSTVPEGVDCLPL